MDQKIEWTTAAEAGFESYFARLAPSLRAEGADPEEVRQDVRQHIEDACRQAQIYLISQDDVQRLLRQMDWPEPDEADLAGSSPTPASHSSSGSEKASVPAAGQPKKPADPTRMQLGEIGFSFAGIILPVAALLGNYWLLQDRSFIYPTPTWMHVLAIALVPLSNGLLLLIHQLRQVPRNWQIGLNGVTIGVSLFYTIVFLPMTLLGLIAVFAWGLGFLLLAPLLALISSAAWGIWLLKKQIPPERKPGRIWGAGIAAGLLLLLGLNAPHTSTWLGLKWVTSVQAADQARGLWWLRHFGSETELLQACYEWERGSVDLLGSLLTLNQVIEVEQARKAFYQLTGKTFNSLPPPQIQTNRDWDPNESFVFDADQGGDLVGSRLAHLDLNASRLDGSLDGRAALGYLEWTLEFANSGKVQQEARALIQLPPGGVVSRLTLWVGNEPREAAFGGREAIKAAYQKVVRARRDPVLVTTQGPDQVLLQCFPVPASGKMKVRLGMSFPLPLVSQSEGWLYLPRLLERNFNLPDTARHQVWVEAQTPLQAIGDGLQAENPKPALYALRGQLSEAQLQNKDQWIRVPRQAQVKQVWTPDAHDGQPVLQTLESNLARPAADLVIVVDGSAAMAESLRGLLDGLSRMPESLHLSAVLVTDQEPQVFENMTRGQLLQALRSFDFRGGRDNLPALIKAWDLAAARGGRMLWLSGPQPVTFASPDALVQRWERRPQGPELDVLQVAPGSNQILNQLAHFAPVHLFHSYAQPAAELNQFWLEWSQQAPHFSFERHKVAAGTLAGIPQTSAHLNRLWAWEQIQQQLRQNHQNEALKLAGAYQLVTPVSAAVVLENEQQYQDAGIKPVDPLSVPAVPEPETWLLLLTALGVVLVLSVQHLRSRSWQLF